MTDIRADEYWAKKGDVDLFVFRNRQAGAAGRPMLFLVHGSSFCGLTGFDLQVPGRDDYSLMDRFAQAGFDVWTGKDAPTLIKRAENLDYFRIHNTRPVDRTFFESIFTRDKPGTSQQIVAETLAATELQYGDTVPTGTYLDMCAYLPVVDPTQITCPVMIVRREHGGFATEEDLMAFFELLPNMDKQFCIFAGQTHVTPLGLNRHRFWHTMEAFLTLPDRLDQDMADG